MKAKKIINKGGELSGYLKWYLCQGHFKKESYKFKS